MEITFIKNESKKIPWFEQPSGTVIKITKSNSYKNFNGLIALVVKKPDFGNATLMNLSKTEIEVPYKIWADDNLDTIYEYEVVGQLNIKE